MFNDAYSIQRLLSLFESALLMGTCSILPAGDIPGAISDNFEVPVVYFDFAIPRSLDWYLAGTD